MARPSFDSMRIAARTLGKQPGFTAVVVLSLALAIAINTTMYSVLDAMLNPRMDIRHPEDVFVVRLFGDFHNKVSRAQRDSMLKNGVSNIESFAWVGAFETKHAIETATTVTEGSVKMVDAEYLRLIGPRVIAGRMFADDDRFATPRPIVLSEVVASSLFNNPVGAIDQNVHIDDSTYRVVGVLSRYSDFPDWRSGAWLVGAPGQRGEGQYTRVIRIKHGASAQDADRELKRVSDQIGIYTGEGPKGVAFMFNRPAVTQFHAGQFHIAIGLSVVAVLLVACANLANMQLARGITRRRELALRSALGASRRRIVMHLLTESSILAVAGLLLGVALTLWGASVLKAIIPPAVASYVVEPQLSWRVFAFALVAMLACIVLIGLAPAIRVSRVDPNEMLKSGAGTGATRAHRRQYGYLVAIEMALALALLSAAALMVRSTLRVGTTDMPFDPTPLIAGVIDAGLKPVAVEQRPASEVFHGGVTRALQATGVVSAAAYTGRGVKDAVTISDSARGVREIPAPNWGYRVVSPGYLRTLGLPIVRGRDFRDGERDEPAVIIDEYTASALWPAANPIGALIKFGDAKSTAPFVRIVGVAGLETQRRGGLPSTTDMRLGLVYYLPAPADSLRIMPGRGWVSFIARAPANTVASAMSLRRLGAKGVASMGERFQQERQGNAFIASMFSLFALLGLGLAAFGVYGVVAHSVAERRRELGVRIALGATARDILHAVLRESVLIGLVGIALGLFATKYGAKLLVQFAGDDVYNAGLFAGASAFLLAVAAFSALTPALRATKVDPTESLRCE